MSETPLPNSAEARTADGTLKDQATAPLGTTVTKTPDPTVTIEEPAPKAPDSSTTAPKAEGSTEPKPEDGKTLLTKEEPKPEDKTASKEGAPEKYEPFKVPEGFELNKDNLAKAEGIFKELGLSQDAGQKLIDLYAEQIKSTITDPHKAFEAQQTEWQQAAQRDPEIGPKVKEIQQTLGRAFDTLDNPALVREFKQVMDLTGAGDNPAFIKVLNAWAQQIIEGRPVRGAGPSPLGMGKLGAKPTAAQALYPNLPSSQS